jgi:glycosyltransferase involved in cell wall biosynthesis
MKILIVVNSLQQGGAERASIRLAESFLTDNHEIVVATWNSNRDFYKLDPNIKRIDIGNFFHYSGLSIPLLGERFKRIGQLFNLRHYRKEIKKVNPDVVICFEALVGSITAVSLLGTKLPVIVSERINPDPMVYEPHQFAKLLRPFIYKRLAICSIQTQGFARWVQANWRIIPVVTPNHVPNDWILNRVNTKSEVTKVISIGRIDPQKGFETLLNAWSRLGNMTEGKTLEIFGRQDDLRYLELLRSKALGNVVFHDAQENIIEILDKSSVFVSSSRFEGFPNVVLEAIARGVPTIASYSSDIVNTLANQKALLGYEPTDEDTLLLHLLKVIGDSSVRNQLSSAAFKAVTSYTWASVGSSWYLAIEKAKEQKN